MATFDNSNTPHWITTFKTLFNSLKMEINKLINTVMLIGFFICLFLMVNLNEGEDKKIHWGFHLNSLIDLLPELTGSLLVGLVVNFTVKRIFDRYSGIENSLIDNEIIKCIRDIAGEFTSEWNKYLKGLKEINVTEVFVKAKEHIQNANTIYIIGTAKQDNKYLEKNTSIIDYLKETVTRVKGTSALEYKRITTLDMKPTFEGHINTLLSENSNNHDLQILILDDFAPAYTYLIIDYSFFMLSLNYSKETNDTFHYYTEDKDTIHQFRKHFESVWDHEIERNKPLKKIADFEYYLSYYKKVKKEFETIKQSIKDYSNYSTYAQKHALIELKEVAKVFESISKNKIEIKHNIDNGNLIALFCSYLNILKNGDSYETITFYDFWKDIIKITYSEPDFIKCNKEALSRGALISRILVLDKKKIHENSLYREGVKTIIFENIEILQEKKGYDFRIFFTENHDMYRMNFYNFAIIKNKIQNSYNEIATEKILFEPSNTNDFNTTRIWFDLVSPNYKSKKAKEFEESKGKLNKIKEKWEKGNILNQLDEVFLSEIIPDISQKEELLIKILGEKATKRTSWFK